MRTACYHKFVVARTAALALLLACSAAAAQGGRLSIERSGGGEPVELAVFDREPGRFVELTELAGALGGELAWTEPGGAIAWWIGGVEFVFSDMSAFFSASGRAYQLTAAPRLENGRFLVPLQVPVEYLPRLLPDRFAWDRMAASLTDRATATQSARATGDGDVYRIRRIVIDPGHGGKDPGTVGRRYRLNEKHIVLELCRMVADRLEKQTGMEVVLTREKDEFIPLGERGMIANRSGAGLFISVHVNASTNRRLDGSSTYFLSAAKTDEERATAMLENAALNYEVDEPDESRRDEIELILQDMAQNEYLRESKDLSAFIQEELGAVPGLKNRGLRQANFAVLRGAYMPAALVETAYISNPEDERKLNTPEFRKRLADAITAGIIKYVDQYHRKLANGS